MTTWTPAVVQAETWTSEAPLPRVFSPLVFSPTPIFDTGGPFWRPKSNASSPWTNE